ncbi:hypothetical protein HK104_003255 [Borealophlyctis nickersoniae]|nr:hypothetical protein HK104_003255 [Borealophlyctis nickersoniae]
MAVATSPCLRSSDCCSPLHDSPTTNGWSNTPTRRCRPDKSFGYTLRAIEQLQKGDHICFLYETVRIRIVSYRICASHCIVVPARLIAGPFGNIIFIFFNHKAEEHRTVTIQFVRGGKQQNQKIVYIGDAITKQAILSYFSPSDSDVDIDDLISKGQFEFLTYDQAYVKNGKFDLHAMLALLQETIDTATSQGYDGLRIVGEMSWILKHMERHEDVVKYESMVNQLFLDSDAIAICQYNRHMFGSQVLLNMINVHPLTCVGLELYDNFYYIPPEEWNSDDRPSVFLKYWLRNLRDRKKVEEELNMTKEVAIAECKSKTEFLNQMSHEIRTPLNGLIGTAEILKDTILNPTARTPSAEISPARSDPDSVHSLLETLGVCSNHLLSVVNDVLDLSRIPHAAAEGTDFPLFKCVDESLQIIRHRATSKNISLSAHIDDSLKVSLGPIGRIRSDESGLRKVLINLLGNATKFTNAGGAINLYLSSVPKSKPPDHILATAHFSTCPRDSSPSSQPSPTLSSSSPSPSPPPQSQETYTRVHFTVEDNGIGIAKSHIPKMFRPFSRVDSARDASDQTIEGTGLGLAISKQLVMRMGGDMWVESEGEGKGTRFQFWVWVKGVRDENRHGDKGPAESETAMVESPMGDGSELGSTGISCGDDGGAGSTGTLIGREGSASSTASLSSLGASSQASPSPVPTSRASSTASSPAPTAQPSVPALSWRTGGEHRPDLRILIVDDNPINRRILRQFLKSFKYNNINECDDGHEAVNHIQSLLPSSTPTSTLPHLILIDYKMPTLNGADACRAIRALCTEHGAPQPFIACLTAVVLEDEMNLCVESGMEEIVIKPLARDGIGRRVWEWGKVVAERWERG